MSKASILIAGSAMNIILGFVIFTVIGMVVGNIKLSPKINSILEGSPAEISGLMVNDEITKINGQLINDVNNDLITYIKSSDGQPFELTFLRDDIESTVVISAKKLNNNSFQIGVSFSTHQTKLNLFQAFINGAQKTIKTVFQSFVGIKMLVTGNASVNDLAGPVGIIQIASSQVQQSVVSFLNLMAFISISLGVINLFPFPVLDGGHLLLLLIETVRGKPLSRSVEAVINNTAAAILIALMVFIVFNDVISWNDRVILLKEMNQ